MLHALLDFLHTLTDPDRLSDLLKTIFSGWLSYAVLFGIVFAETGLLVGFFLPGDSLLFTVGVVAGMGHLKLGWVILILSAGALLGDSTGYWLGRKTGPRIFSRPDSRIFKQEYIRRTHAYYERYGGKTIILARFLPIVRTFAAFVAGVGQMPYLKFLPYSVCGGIGWVALMSTLGYELGSIPLVRRHFEKFVVLIVILSLLPSLIEVLRARRKPETEQEVVSR